MPFSIWLLVLLDRAVYRQRLIRAYTNLKIERLSSRFLPRLVDLCDSFPGLYFKIIKPCYRFLLDKESLSCSKLALYNKVLLWYILWDKRQLQKMVSGLKRDCTNPAAEVGGVC